MKKLILLTLLIVGCDSGSSDKITTNEDDTSLNIIGMWESLFNRTTNIETGEIDTLEYYGPPSCPYIHHFVSLGVFGFGYRLMESDFTNGTSSCGSINYIVELDSLTWKVDADQIKFYNYNSPDSLVMAADYSINGDTLIRSKPPYCLTADDIGGQDCP